MNRRKYYIMVTEGVTDCSLIEAVLEKYLGYNPYQNVRELPSLFEAMIGIYPMRSGELKRQDSPTFYYKDSVELAVKQANGYSNIPQKISSLVEIIDKFELYDSFGGFLIFCDTDTKSKEEIKEIFKRKFEENEILFEDGFLNVYNHQIKCNMHLFPATGLGAIEKLLLECSNISYNQLSHDAQEYKNKIMGNEYAGVRKECWASDTVIQEFYADKVQFGAISSVLKPDRPVRFTIKDKIIRTKYYESYMELPEFRELHNFLINNLEDARVKSLKPRCACT